MNGDMTAGEGPSGAAEPPAHRFWLLLVARVVGIYARRASAE
jgi:hypothetical protein